MKKIRLSFSQTVLERKRKRRNAAFGLVLRIALIALILGNFSVDLWLGHTRAKAMLLSASPTWADFSIRGGLNETTVGYYNGGLPRQLTINGRRWSIVQVDHFDDAVGRNLTIAFIPTTDHQDLKINLMHEVFHAGACAYGGNTWWNSTDNEHPGIYHLGEFMAIFARDNPQFMAWEMYQ